VAYYVSLLTNPDSLRGTFAFYREWDMLTSFLAPYRNGAAASQTHAHAGK
jgi:hypothetical protein